MPSSLRSKKAWRCFFRPLPDFGKRLDKWACDMSERKNMPDLLVPDRDPATYERLRQAAAERGKSLAQTARDLL
jgi:hypothetical protein